MQFTKKNQTQGLWVKKEEVENDTKATIVSDVQQVDGQYGTQNIVKVSLGKEEEAQNLALNNITINGLIDAFGSESSDWVNKELYTYKEKMNVSGRRVTALYLIAKGFEITEDEGGYIVITKKDVDIEELGEEDKPF